MDFQDAIRKRIAGRSEEMGLPRTGKIYTEAGLGSTTIRNFIDRMTRSLTVDTAEKLAPVLKVSAQWILYGETAEIVALWERVPVDRRPMAKDILERIADEEPLQS